jgi:hypothetical protein
MSSLLNSISVTLYFTYLSVPRRHLSNLQAAPESSGFEKKERKE